VSAALIIGGLAIGLLGFFAGAYFGGAAGRRRAREADGHYETLKRDFETVSAVNLQLLRRQQAKAPAVPAGDALQHFLDLYDEAKRCLHRALDRHNATAPRPIVITRDGANVLQALTDLPPLSFSEDPRKDAGVRSWLYRVLELDLERRRLRQAPAADDVIALVRERELWSTALKKSA